MENMRTVKAVESDYIELLRVLMTVSSQRNTIFWFNQFASHIWTFSNAEASRVLSEQAGLFHEHGEFIVMRNGIRNFPQTSRRLAMFRLMHNALLPAFPSPNLARYGINLPAFFDGNSGYMTPRELLIAEPSIRTMTKLRTFFATVD